MTMWGIEQSVIGFVNVEDDTAGEDGVDHAGQPETREWVRLFNANVAMWHGTTYNEMTKKRSRFQNSHI